jgi:hypothetical protein
MSDCPDAALAFAGMISWLKRQDAQEISLSYSKLRDQDSSKNLKVGANNR